MRLLELEFELLELLDVSGMWLELLDVPGMSSEPLELGLELMKLLELLELWELVGTLELQLGDVFWDISIRSPLEDDAERGGGVLDAVAACWFPLIRARAA